MNVDSKNWRLHNSGSWTQTSDSPSQSETYRPSDQPNVNDSIARIEQFSPKDWSVAEFKHVGKND